MAQTPREVAPIAERHREAIEALVREHSDASPERVETLYRNELDRLEPEARITQYLPVIVSRNVRELLRRKQRLRSPSDTALSRSF